MAAAEALFITYQIYCNDTQFGYEDHESVGVATSSGDVMHTFIWLIYATYI